MYRHIICGATKSQRQNKVETFFFFQQSFLSTEFYINTLICNLNNPSYHANPWEITTKSQYLHTDLLVIIFNGHKNETK